MATINIDPSISLGAKPPTVMTLPDMLNLARGAQQFRQAEQLMPLQVEQQQAQTGLAKTQEMAGSENLSKSRADRVFGIVGGFMNDPRIASGDRQKTVEAMLEIRRKAIASGVPEAQVEAILSPITATAAHNPQALPQMISNVIQSQLGAQGQQGLQTPEIVESGGQPGVFRRGPGTVEPLPMPGAPAPTPAPMAAPTPAPRGVTSEDMTAPMGTRAPAPQTAPAMAPTSGEMVQPTTERLPLIHPVRKAGVPFAQLAEEETDRKAGSDLRTNLVQRQSELVTARRNLQEVVRTAQKLEEESVLPETGPIGAIKRGFANWIGDPTYKQLSKDIANVQIANIKAMGGSMDTVSGQALSRMASGDETFPPEVLLSIARRADADITNLDMMATGLQRHSQKFGDNNAKRFQQMWSANADSRIFELMNISRDIKDPQKRKDYAEKLLGNLDENQRQDLFRKYNNVVKLSKTGDL
jgi:hypothetical protein